MHELENYDHFDLDYSEWSHEMNPALDVRDGVNQGVSMQNWTDTTARGKLADDSYWKYWHGPYPDGLPAGATLDPIAHKHASTSRYKHAGEEAHFSGKFFMNNYKQAAIPPQQTG